MIQFGSAADRLGEFRQCTVSPFLILTLFGLRRGRKVAQLSEICFNWSIFKFGKAKKQKIHMCLMWSIFDSAGVKWG